MTDAELVVRHFLVCRRVRYDPRVPLAPYSIRSVVFRYRPVWGFPVVVPALWVFAHFEGTGGHELWIEVAPFADEDGRPEPVASYGPYPVHLGPSPAQLTRGWRLRGVPFPNPGMYSVNITLAGVILAQHFLTLEE